MFRMDKVRESKTAELHTQKPRYKSLVKHFFFLGYIISRTPMQILMVKPSACSLHNARDHTYFYNVTHTIYAAFPPRTPVSYLLLVPGAFPIIFIPSPTSLIISTDVKEVFKSISNSYSLYIRTFWVIKGKEKKLIIFLYISVVQRIDKKRPKNLKSLCDSLQGHLMDMPILYERQLFIVSVL